MRPFKPVVALLFALLGGLAGCGRAVDSTAGATTAPTQWDARLAVYNYDAAQPLNAAMLKSSETAVASLQSWTLTGALGHSVPFYFIEPVTASAAQPAPVVVVIHGLNSNIDQMVPIGMLLASRGYGAIIPEIVGHGQRSDPATPLFSGDPKRLRDGLVESVGDIRRSIDFLNTRPEIDKTRIGLAGFSLGAMLGSVVAGVDTRVVTAVLVVGGGDWKVILAESQQVFARSRRDAAPIADDDLKILADVDPVNFIGHVSPRPVLLINGTRDRIIPQKAALALFAAAGEPKKQIWLDSGHIVDPNLVGPPAFDWLGQYLLHPANTPAAVAH